MSSKIIFGGGDTVPDAFSFSTTSGASISTAYTQTSSITGYDTATSWSVSGGTGSTDGSNYSTSGSISPGQTFYVRVTSSGSYSSSVVATVTIGGVVGTYTVTTRAADTVPDQFTFNDDTNVPLNQTRIAFATPTGYDYANWTVTGGAGAVGAGAYSTSGIIYAGETFYIRLNSSPNFSTSVSATATIGGVSDTYTSTTRAADTSPDSFVFTSITSAERSTTTTSNTATVTGLEPSYSYTIIGTGGTVDAGTSSLSGTFASSKTVTSSGSGTLVLAIRTTSSASFSTQVSASANVGTGSGTFSVTTRSADETPAAFAFTANTGVNLSTVCTSNTATITGLEPYYSITVSASGGTVDAGSDNLTGTFSSSKTVTTSASGTLVVAARVTSSASSSTTVNCTVTIGTGSAVYSVTTATIGSASYTTAGSYTWTCPSGVTSISVVAVGACGYGTGTPNGTGGGLGWKNNIAVTPGTGYTVVVGAVGTSSTINGGSSYFINTSTVAGGGGSGGSTAASGPLYGTAATGGGYIGDGGGNGGTSPARASISSPAYNGSGGAGGYSGNGGNGGTATSSNTASTAGTAGGGGGGGGGSGARASSGGGVPGGAGGGVGILGQGSNGAAGPSPATSSTSISGVAGSPGSGGSGSSYGGGPTGGNGASGGGGGAVRIIWGPGRSYPSNAT